MKYLEGLSISTLSLANDDSDGCPLPEWFEKMDNDEPKDEGPSDQLLMC